MRRFQINMLTVILLACLLQVQAQAAKNEEAALVADLFADYNSDIKPTLKRSDQIIVTLSFILSKIGGLDETAGTMTSFGWLTAYWQDVTLSWKQRNYNNITSITVPSAKVWKPEISVHNSVVNGNDASLDTNLNYRVSILHTGTVIWTPFFTWVTSCNMDVLYFPFDTQVCSIMFLNWVYSSTFINYTISTANPVDVRAMENSSEWTLVSTKTGVYMVYAPTAALSYPMAYLELTLKRVPYYFVFNIIMPTVCLSTLSTLAFLIPAQAGEKMGLSVTLLMSYSVILLLLADNVPRSNNLPIMMYYILTCFLLNAFSSVASAIVLHLSDGGFICGKTRHHDNDNVHLTAITNNNKTVVTSENNDSNSNNIRSNHRSKSRDRIHTEEVEAGSDDHHSNLTTVFGKATDMDNFSDIGRNLAALVELLQKKQQKKKKKKQEAERWAKIANVVDRVLFAVFLMATIVLGVTCLGLALVGANKTTPRFIF